MYINIKIIKSKREEKWRTLYILFEITENNLVFYKKNKDT